MSCAPDGRRHVVVAVTEVWAGRGSSEQSVMLSGRFQWRRCGRQSYELGEKVVGLHLRSDSGATDRHAIRRERLFWGPRVIYRGLVEEIRSIFLTSILTSNLSILIFMTFIFLNIAAHIHMAALTTAQPSPGTRPWPTHRKNFPPVSHQTISLPPKLASDLWLLQPLRPGIAKVQACIFAATSRP